MVYTYMCVCVRGSGAKWIVIIHVRDYDRTGNELCGNATRHGRIKRGKPTPERVPKRLSSGAEDDTAFGVPENGIARCSVHAHVSWTVFSTAEFVRLFAPMCVRNYMARVRPEALRHERQQSADEHADVSPICSLIFAFRASWRPFFRPTGSGLANNSYPKRYCAQAVGGALYAPSLQWLKRKVLLHIPVYPCMTTAIATYVVCTSPTTDQCERDIFWY
jgi:hypothetical protein